MSTKSNPGAFRCYEAALPDEHIFTILARDPAGPATLRFWAAERKRVGKTVNVDDCDRIEDAIRDAVDMETWRMNNLDPMGDGQPTWKHVRMTDDELGPLHIRPDDVQYVAAERDGSEAVRLSIDWFGRHLDLLEQGRTSRTEFAALMRLSLQSPDRRERVVPVEEAAFDAAKRDDRAIRLLATVRKAAEQIDRFPEAVKLEAGTCLREVREGLAAALDATVGPSYSEYVKEAAQPSHARPPLIDDAPGDLAHSPEVPPHRFSTFHKGERYAYARGLEINPIHLPVCLDEMARDGWDLLAIFGETDSKHVGFIFQRQPPPVYIGEFQPLTPLDRDAKGRMKNWLQGGPMTPEPIDLKMGDRFIVEYIDRVGEHECKRTRIQESQWPEWATGCGPGGRGRGLEP